MKKKYSITLVLVGVLIAVVSISYAYFIAKLSQQGGGSSVTVKTVELGEVGFVIEGELEFNDLDIYPGHKNISKIKVTANGQNRTTEYNLVWNGINTLKTPLKYYVYKTTTSETPSITCEKIQEKQGLTTIYYETCENKNFDNLGDMVTSGEITTAETITKFNLLENEVIKATPTGETIYYYVILEFPNLTTKQNYDANGSFNGTVTVVKAEDTNTLADITITKMYQQNNTTYDEITTMPTKDSGYVLNTEKSTCSNNTKLSWNEDSWKVQLTSLTSSGTECNLYFDKKSEYTSTDTLKKLNITNYKTDSPTFTSVATTDEGIFQTDDPMYKTEANPNPKTYYWRGAATTNHLIFANKCWRIVRINGDGTIRLIYNGAVQSGNTCNASVGNTDAVIYSSTTADRYYATSGGAYNNKSYVGWTYTLNSQRTLSGTDSNAKTQTEKWFNNNSNFTADQREQVATGKFCNDREVQSGSSFTSSSFNYAGSERLYTGYKPTLECNEGDIYKVQVAAITADEVEFAGGKDTNNTSYYLHAGQNYWTMSPYYWNGTRASVFVVRNDGYLSTGGVSLTYGVRPVINLKTDVAFESGGLGTYDKPYIAKGAA